MIIEGLLLIVIALGLFAVIRHEMVAVEQMHHDAVLHAFAKSLKK